MTLNPVRWFAALADRVLAPSPSTWEFASASHDSRRGGESGTPTPSSVPANRPGGCSSQ